MRVWVLSDLHVEFAPFEFSAVGAAALVVAGDVGVGVRGVDCLLALAPLPVVYVAGNHEYYRGAIPRVTYKLRDKCKGTNVRFLDDGEVVIGGVRFVGSTLWTDFELFGAEGRARAMEEARARMMDFRLIRRSPEFRKFTPADSAMLHRRSCGFIERAVAGSAERVVVVTHHAPHPMCVREKYRGELLSAAYASDLTGLMERVRPAVWVSGHTHGCVDFMVGGTRVVSNQRGYPAEETGGFRGDFLVEV